MMGYWTFCATQNCVARYVAKETEKTQDMDVSDVSYEELKLKKQPLAVDIHVFMLSGQSDVCSFTCTLHR